MDIKHNFNSGKSDGGDPTQVQPSHWNDSHALTMTDAGLVGRSTAGAGSAGEIAVGSGLTLASGTLASSGGGGVANAAATILLAQQFGAL